MSNRDIARRALPARRALLGAWALGVLSQGAQVALLATSAWLITRAAEQPPILYLTFAIVAVRAFAIGRAAFRYVERVISHDGAFRALAELRVWIYRRLVPLAPAGLQRVGRGSVLSTVVRDVDTLQDYPLRVIQPVSTALSVVGLSVIGLALIDPVAAGVLALILVLTGLFSVAWTRRVSAQAERELSPVRAQMADAIIDTLARRAVLRAFDAEDVAEAQVVDVDEKLEAVERRIARGQHLVSGVMVLSAGLAVSAMAWLSLDRLNDGLTGPVFALLVLTPLAVVEVFGAVPLALSALRGVDESASRISNLVPDTLPAGIPAEQESDEVSESVKRQVDSLELRDFCSKWPGRERCSYAPVSLSLSRGDAALVTGPSGVGKSTLAAALVGFVDFEGEFLLGAESVRNISVRELREHVVLIEQAPHLFDASLRHNLSFASPGASDKRLWEVLTSVGLAEWAQERGGLDCELGEAGALVSGGQAQRIALARAFLCEAPVIILDEPTANVDTVIAEVLMADLLGALASRGDAMAIVISHQPVALTPSHKSVVLRPAH